jgi:hypothetical protein
MTTTILDRFFMARSEKKSIVSENYMSVLEQMKNCIIKAENEIKELDKGYSIMVKKGAYARDDPDYDPYDIRLPSLHKNGPRAGEIYKFRNEILEVHKKLLGELASLMEKLK